MYMNLWLIIPAKPFDQSKSRLASVLDPAERAALSRHLLTHVITTAQRAAICTQIVVTSRDRRVLAHAAALGTQTVREEPPFRFELPQERHPGVQRGMEPVSPYPEPGSRLEPMLNRALDRARSVAMQHGADAILILPADLPCVQPQDLLDLHAAARAGAQMVIVPSRDGGTNALLLHPPTNLQFAFGRKSFQRHRRQAEAANVPYRIVHSTRLAFDLDQPQDLACWQEKEASTARADGLCTAW